MANMLIVDDDEAIRELIQEGLEGLGHTFTLSSSGADALQKIAKIQFDLVILDRNMPKLTGIDVLKTLRRSPATEKLKVIICTGADMLAEVDEAFTAGASDYIVKPFDFEKLRAKVARHIKP